jgi:hypothetical protein
MTASAIPSLIIHIGQHKTGSKALQAFLAHNRDELRDRGLLYPVDNRPTHDVPAYVRSQFRLFALLRHEAVAVTAGRAAADAYWRTVAPYCRPFATAGEYLSALEEDSWWAGAHGVILSAEDLFDMHTAHEINFAPERIEAGVKLLAGAVSVLNMAVRVVVYLRRQDHLLGAQYGQFIKGAAHDIDLTQFGKAFAPRLDSSRLLGYWESAFGRERIRVRPYERQAMPGGIVAHFFDHGLGWSVPGGMNVPPADIESTNVSLGRDLIEYLLLLNRRTASGNEVQGRELVLRAAVRYGPRVSGPAGIAAWLSPSQRQMLLARHSAGNARIAREYLGRDQLFAEPPPEDAGWTAYPGLSSSRLREITRLIVG